MEFNHGKLEAYQVSIKLLRTVFQTIEKIPAGYAVMTDQLKLAFKEVFAEIMGLRPLFLSGF